MNRLMMRSSNAVWSQVAMFFSRRLAAFMLTFIAFPALASVSVSLAWNPSPDSSVAGYKVYYGVASHVYTNSVDVGLVTNATIAGLSPNVTYYFAATTHDSSGAESVFSNEAVYTVPQAQATSNSVVTAQGVVAGQNVSLSVAAQGTGQLKYQWKFNSSIIATATNAVLSLNQVLAAQSGIYSVTVTDGNGLTTNIAANLTIYPTAAATLTQPTLAGKQYSFNVTGVAGGQYVVERSTNLSDWLPVQTNTSPFTFVDPNATRFNQCFYRTLSVLAGTGGNAGSAQSATLPVQSTLSQPVYANGQYSFNVAGTTGSQFIVQGSTNLVNWVSLAINTAPFAFTDVNAGQFKQRFYRTLALTNAAAGLPANPQVSATNTTAALTQPAYADGQYSFDVTGVTGLQYIVQASTNLVNWVSLATNTAPFAFTDVNAGQFQQRFYRTLALTNAPASLSANLVVSANTAATLTQPAYANGQYSFTVAGTTGFQYVVQASTNLVNWVSVATNTAPFNFVDSQAGQFQQRFYRAF